MSKIDLTEKIVDGEHISPVLPKEIKMTKTQLAAHIAQVKQVLLNGWNL